MFSKFKQQYLLTHHPLVWNTRFITVLLVNFLIHLFFFLVGWGSIRLDRLKELSAPPDLAGGALITFSILCSLLVLIVWLMYALRHNAFKNFYRIDSWHLAKEFMIIYLVVLSSISYFSSYHNGALLKVRTVTDQKTFISEVNTINRAMAFVPLDTSDYSFFQDCEKDHNSRSYSIIEGPSRQIVAFFPEGRYSYRNYCKRFIWHDEFDNISSPKEISRNTRRLLANKNRDSIQLLLEALRKICEKYSIPHHLNTGQLAAWPFLDSANSLSEILFDGMHTEFIPTGKNYLNSYDLRRSMYFISKCLPGGRSADDAPVFLILAYIAMGLSVLILTYRRFSRKIFLISVVGSLVWLILIGLLSAGAESDLFFVIFCILLFVVFLLFALLNLKTGSLKTLTGALLSWHVYLAPYIVLFLSVIVEDYYQKKLNAAPEFAISDQFMQAHYPVSHWITHHIYEISLINLVLVLFYISFLFNRWAKRHHTMPQE